MATPPVALGVREVGAVSEIDDYKRGGEWHRELTPNPVAKGLEYANYFQQELRTRNIPHIRSSDKLIKKGGDPGWDFKIGKYLIDVKGTDYINNVNLLVEEGKIKAHIYVFYSRIRALGFATNKNLKARTPRKWPGEVVNHIIPEDDLRPMAELWRVLKKP